MKEIEEIEIEGPRETTREELEELEIEKINKRKEFEIELQTIANITNELNTFTIFLAVLTN